MAGEKKPFLLAYNYSMLLKDFYTKDQKSPTTVLSKGEFFALISREEIML
jgi:hypothetical protein